MNEMDLIGGLADIDESLKAGLAIQKGMAERLNELAQALRKMPAPQVTVQAPITMPPAPQPLVQVMPAPAVAAEPGSDWVHTHHYDDGGRLVKTVSTRTAKG
jgi:hypothetical protein